MEDEKHPAKLQTHRRKTAVFAPMAKLCDVVGLSSKPSVFALAERLRLAAEGRWYLEPANPAFQCIRPLTSPEVPGAVVGLVRRFRT